MKESKAKPVAVVIGVGPGLGASLARRFAKEYAVAINARTPIICALWPLTSATREAARSKSQPTSEMASRSQRHSN